MPSHVLASRVCACCVCVPTQVNLNRAGFQLYNYMQPEGLAGGFRDQFIELDPRRYHSRHSRLPLSACTHTRPATRLANKSQQLATTLRNARAALAYVARARVCLSVSGTRTSRPTRCSTTPSARGSTRASTSVGSIRSPTWGGSASPTAASSACCACATRRRSPSGWRRW
eukprot:6065742-Prymnesium_polylepis.1